MTTDDDGLRARIERLARAGCGATSAELWQALRHDPEPVVKLPPLETYARYCTGTPVAQDMGVCDDAYCPKHGMWDA